jgi:Flp pilus assembly protein protease CpaA
MFRIGLRAAMIFAFSIFGRKVIALAGTVVLLFATAIFFDVKTYITAGLASALSLMILIIFCIQYRRQIKANRLRAQREKEEMIRRAAATARTGKWIEPRARSRIPSKA